MSNELPEGWAETTVGEVAEDISYGYTARAVRNAKGPRYLRITDIQNNSVDWASVPSCAIPSKRLPAYQLRSGDLVFARTGATTGKSFLIKSCPEAVFASYLIRIRPGTSLVPEFIARFFQSADYWSQISENISGSAQPNCNATKLSTLVVPIPPLSEQRRIVAKLEKLLSQVDTSKQRLARIDVLLKRFRQSVVAAACSGRLTADWRERNADLAPVQFGSDSNNLPDSWRESPLSDVVRVSSGEAFKKSEYSPSGAKLLQIANVSFGKIIWDQQNFLPPSYLKSHAELVLNEGDILMALNRPLLNWRIKVARLTKADLPAILYQRVGRFSFIGGERSINAEFLFLYLQSLEFIHELSERLRGTDQPYVNPPEMLEIVFSVPPLSEQQEIVRRVEKLLALADRLEARFLEGQKRVDSITQAILAKAFRGDLVPTEFELAKAEGRSFESAQELLVRISRNGGVETKKPISSKTNL